jgi:hypothetical protein
MVREDTSVRRLRSWPKEDRLQRLAQRIRSLEETDERRLRRAHEVEAMRRDAARELHSICEDFVAAVNGMLAEPLVLLDPPEFSAASYSDKSPNLVQINVHGRILQISFAATAELVSTEDFRIPYILEGSVRAFNREMLDKDLIEEQPLFYTMERSRNMWRYFESRTYHSGPFDRDYLISVTEQIL